MRALVLNYGVGNLYSISSGLRRVGFEVRIDNDIRGDYDLIVLPGVGAFSAVSSFLNNINERLNELKEKGTSFLGVCLGMQVMFEYGTEGGISRGLGWFKGYVDKIKADVKLPHIGWDKVYIINSSCELVEGLDGKYVYYVHSYIAYPSEDNIVFMESNYGVKYPALICKGNAVGTQFHPEKSSYVGRVFLDNLKRWIKR